jgi:hypothetical protein
MIDPSLLRAAILDLTIARGPDRSICPSEAARAVAGEDGDWRALMNDTRAVAADLVAHGLIVVTQRGHIVDPATARGPIRLRQRLD